MPKGRTDEGCYFRKIGIQDGYMKMELNSSSVKPGIATWCECRMLTWGHSHRLDLLVSLSGFFNFVNVNFSTCCFPQSKEDYIWTPVRYDSWWKSGWVRTDSPPDLEPHYTDSNYALGDSFLYRNIGRKYCSKRNMIFA